MNERRSKKARDALDLPRVIMLYDSVFGNTKKVALTLSRGLEAGGFVVDAQYIGTFNLNKLEKYNVIGIGGPTHVHGASKAMKSFLSQIKDRKLHDKKGFAFETKISHPLAGSAAKKILRTLKKMKVKPVYPRITAIVVGREGPLEEGTSSKMEKIGIEIAELLNIKN